MAAIITEQYRKNSAQTLIADVTENLEAKYYVGLGKSDDWYEKLSAGQEAPFPIGSASDARGVQHALTDIINVGPSNIKTVIPLVTPSASKFKAYNPYDPTSFYPSTVGADTIKPAYFVDEVSGHVYLFIRSSSTQPLALSNNGSGSDTSKITAGENLIITSSQHVIVKIGKIVTLSKFNNEQFVEIDLTLNNDDVYCPGYIYGLHALNGGLYKVGAIAPTGVITGTAVANGVDSAGASITLSIPFNANVTGGVITSIELDDYESIVTEQYDATPFADAVIRLTNITVATSTTNGISSGDAVTETTASVIAPMLSNINGFGQDITKYTPAWYVCFLVNTRSSTHAVYSDYAQVSLLKNPIKESDDQLITSPVVSMTKSFKLTGYAFGNDIKGYQIVQSSGGNITKRIGVVDSYDTATKTVYYNCSLKYGFDTPSTSSPIIFVKGASTFTPGINPTVLTSPDFLPGSADVLFIDNRVSIVRSADQNEELKIIIQL
jgi:hypothetical protein